VISNKIVYDSRDNNILHIINIYIYIYFFFPAALFSEIVLQVKNLGSIGLLKNLIPDLKNVLPSDAIKYVPYEVGCLNLIFINLHIKV